MPPPHTAASSHSGASGVGSPWQLAARHKPPHSCGTKGTHSTKLRRCGMTAPPPRRRPVRTRFRVVWCTRARRPQKAAAHAEAHHVVWRCTAGHVRERKCAMRGPRTDCSIVVGPEHARHSSCASVQVVAQTAVSLPCTDTRRPDLKREWPRQQAKDRMCAVLQPLWTRP